MDTPRRRAATRSAAARDPRIYQLLTLSSLLAYGVAALDFGVGPLDCAMVLGTCLAVQTVAGRLSARRRLGPPAGSDGGRSAGDGEIPHSFILPENRKDFAHAAPSALISGLSLCLLLRTGSPALACVAATLAIGSKFLLRWRGKHLFNPTNFALVVLLLATDHRVWVSSGQWGNAALLGFLIACVGGLVVTRAARADVTLAFLGFYLAILLGRALWLGQPLAIPCHQLESGGLLIFAFFMISDPKTTPDSRAGRILFAAFVALGAGSIQFLLFRPNGLLFALAACAPAVPVLDRLLPGRRYSWEARPAVLVPSRPLERRLA